MDNVLRFNGRLLPSPGERTLLKDKQKSDSNTHTFTSGQQPHWPVDGLRNARACLTSSGRPQMERWLRFAVRETRAALFV